MTINCSAAIAKFLVSNPIVGGSVFILQTPMFRVVWPRVPDNRMDPPDTRSAMA